MKTRQRIFRHTKEEKIGHQQIHAKKRKLKKKKVLQAKGKVIPDENLSLHKGMKSTENGC